MVPLAPKNLPCPWYTEFSAAPKNKARESRFRPLASLTADHQNIVLMSFRDYFKRLKLSLKAVVFYRPRPRGGLEQCCLVLLW